MDNVEIFDLKKVLVEGAFSAVSQAIAGAFGQMLCNKPKDRIATQIEILVNLDDPEVINRQAFLAIMQNAFISAFECDFGRETKPQSSPSEVVKIENQPEPRAKNFPLWPIWQACKS